MAQLQTLGIAKMLSRAEAQPATTTVVDSLSIRGTGHATGSFASRSPSHSNTSGVGLGHVTSVGSSGKSRNAQRGTARGPSSSTAQKRQQDYNGGSTVGGMGGGVGGGGGSTPSRFGGLKDSGGSGGGGGRFAPKGTVANATDGGEGASAGAGEVASRSRLGTGRRRPQEARFEPGIAAGVRGGLCGGIRDSDVEAGEDGERGQGGGSDYGGDFVTIHVCDESRGITRDFSCERRLLLREMKYFQSYLVGASSPYDEIDILVHCDVRIFEWLFEYIHSSDGDRGESADTADGAGDKHSGTAMRGGDGQRSPPLEVPVVVSILISSDFLQMRRLVLECLSFLGEHLSEIVKLPIDLSCLGDKMVLQLAKMVTLEQLAVAKDRKDKLLSRVHKKRIELDFRDRSPHSESAIHCCRHCARLFSEKVRNVLSCCSAPPAVDFRGRLVRRHEALSPWSLTRTVTSLHRRGMSWTAVYWFLWGLTQPLTCVECGEVFLAGDLGECRSHPNEAFFPGSWEGPLEHSEIGVTGKGGEGLLLEGCYPCCQQMVYRFNLEPAPVGCVTGDHTVSEEAEDSLVMKVLGLRRHSISYDDWRDAVREETRAAIENARSSGTVVGGERNPGSDRFTPPLVGGSSNAAPRGRLSFQCNHVVGSLPQSGGDGEDRVHSGGSGGALGVAVTGTSKSCISGGREKATVKRQPSAGRRAPKGIESLTTTAAALSAQTSTDMQGSRPCATSGGSTGRGHVQSGVAASEPSGTTMPVAITPQSSRNECLDAAAGSGSGGSECVEVTIVGCRSSTNDGTLSRNHGGHEAEGNASGRRTEEREERRVASRGQDPHTAEEAVVGTAIETSIRRVGTFPRIWETQASEALSARERGMLPNEHPLQFSSKEGTGAWDLARGGDTRSNTTAMGENALRRWQTDTLRENDGHRMAKICEELHRKRNANSSNDGSRASERAGRGAGIDLDFAGSRSRPVQIDTKQASAWQWGGGRIAGIGSSQTQGVGGSGSGSRRVSVSSGGDGRRRRL